jgi:hypothetical protein
MTSATESHFTQTDALDGMGSPYAYGYNNPTVFVDPSGLRGVAKYLLLDSDACPNCTAKQGGSRTSGAAGTWSPGAYGDDSIRAGAAYGIDPRLVCGIFTQEASGSLPQGSGFNRSGPRVGPGVLRQDTFGPTNLTESTLNGLLSRDPALRSQLQGMARQLGKMGTSAVNGADAVRVLIYHEVFESGHESFAANATASRLRELQDLVRKRARLKGFKEVRGEAIKTALADTSSQSVYESAMIGAAYNAQTTDADRIVSIDAKLDFAADATPSLVNNSGGAGVYSNRYRSSFCSAGRSLGSQGSAC